MKPSDNQPDEVRGDWAISGEEKELVSTDGERVGDPQHRRETLIGTNAEQMADIPDPDQAVAVKTVWNRRRRNDIVATQIATYGNATPSMSRKG